MILVPLFSYFKSIFIDLLFALLLDFSPQENFLLLWYSKEVTLSTANSTSCSFFLELELTKIQNEKHLKCYLVAKCIYYASIKSFVVEQDKSLPSYFLKTTWFNLLEKHPEPWFEDRSIFYIIGELYGQLAVCFGAGYMENIFVSGMNILREVQFFDLF